MPGSRPGMTIQVHTAPSERAGNTSSVGDVGGRNKSGHGVFNLQHGMDAVKIRDIEVFQVAWAPGDRPEQRSAWVRLHCDDGSFGLGEASPMQGGIASLGIIARNLAPALIGKDPLD